MKHNVKFMVEMIRDVGVVLLVLVTGGKGGAPVSPSIAELA